MRHSMSNNVQQSTHAVGIQCAVGLSALGSQQDDIRNHLTRETNTLTLMPNLLAEREVWVGHYPHELVEGIDVLKESMSRNLRFALTALKQIESQVKEKTVNIEKQRLAIVMGTSTSGIQDNEQPLKAHFLGLSDELISYQKQEMGCLAKALQHYLGWQGPAYTISTACSSSAKAMAAGQRLINADLADVVLVGGVDTLCKLTLNGFNSLESLSNGICRPCGTQRDGINIGEAAALFLLSKQSAPVMLFGTGESMDAWHISAPHPDGKGAAEAMQKALNMAGLKAEDIGYLNLHGTSTLQNDAMEIKAVQTVFKDYAVPLSSTKHKTGHCLGAAGAIEAFICHQILQDQLSQDQLSQGQCWLPVHQSGDIDPELSGQNYVLEPSSTSRIRYVMSNSFAFGGSNISLILGCSQS
ncbi:beta-ketoacyl-[acyl-carrier-protein] synthase family protein [Acinetobacter sp. TGL-Y2]|uniref:beta-ketoacyl-[acyl-carrier-protein] synthase family protein n=1 Tax=Acinetobacter sp. TGL-Y2 TaxID=1407071 RepID=UPI001D176744|nr:beta-ketoacyl-[acyl-carrier-protein] synthase family protein [Acinetobacter sp. TGL-Y2]